MNACFIEVGGCYSNGKVFAIPLNVTLPELIDWDFVNARLIHTVNVAGV